MTSKGYRDHLQSAVAASAAPYGYTLTTWTSGAIATHAQGSTPTAVDALLLLAGAVGGFLAVGVAAYGGVHELLTPGPPGEVRLWGGAHLPSVGLAIGVVVLLCAVVSGPVLWLLVGFGATVSYLAVIGLQFWAATHREPSSGADLSGAGRG